MTAKELEQFNDSKSKMQQRLYDTLFEISFVSKDLNKLMDILNECEDFKQLNKIKAFEAIVKCKYDKVRW